MNHIFIYSAIQWAHGQSLCVKKKSESRAYSFGEISKQGKTPICIEEYGMKITEQKYKKVLKEKLVSYSEIMFSDRFYTAYKITPDRILDQKLQNG